MRRSSRRGSRTPAMQPRGPRTDGSRVTGSLRRATATMSSEREVAPVNDGQSDLLGQGAWRLVHLNTPRPTRQAQCSVVGARLVASSSRCTARLSNPGGCRSTTGSVFANVERRAALAGYVCSPPAMPVADQTHTIVRRAVQYPSHSVVDGPPGRSSQCSTATSEATSAALPRCPQRGSGLLRGFQCGRWRWLRLLEEDARVSRTSVGVFHRDRGAFGIAVLRVGLPCYGRGPSACRDGRHRDGCNPLHRSGHPARPSGARGHAHAGLQACVDMLAKAQRGCTVARMTAARKSQRRAFEWLPGTSG